MSVSSNSRIKIVHHVPIPSHKVNHQLLERYIAITIDVCVFKTYFDLFVI